MAEYLIFDLQNIAGLVEILKSHPNLKGLNVTIPYKQAILAFLDEIDPEAEKIGAVNTIKIKNGKLMGYNTDVFGFAKAISPLLDPFHEKALIIGTGGASKAVAYGLKKMGIPFQVISRNPSGKQISYEQLSEEIIQDHPIIINCTPLGTFPKVETFPDIPYQYIGKKHLLFDLTYTPPLTKFLELGKNQGAKTENGLNMLRFQAEKAWEIWN